MAIKESTESKQKIKETHLQQQEEFDRHLLEEVTANGLYRNSKQGIALLLNTREDMSEEYETLGPVFYDTAITGHETVTLNNGVQESVNTTFPEPETCQKMDSEHDESSQVVVEEEVGTDISKEAYTNKIIIKKSYAVPLSKLIEREEKEPPMEMLWGGIPKGSFGFVFGASKSGKTVFTENLGMSIAAGLDSFMGLPLLKTSGKVLFISMEEFWRQRTNRNKIQAEALSKRLGNRNWIDNYIAINEDFPRVMSDKNDWVKLANILEEHTGEVVIIDSLGRLNSDAIEDSQTCKELCINLRELTNKYKITLIAIHHTHKQHGKALTIDSLAGSRVLAQEADFMIGINKGGKGTRYVKDVAYRYSAEDTENVTPFIMDGDRWIQPQAKCSEFIILSEADGRYVANNEELLFEYIKEKEAAGTKEITTAEIKREFVPGQMSKDTMHTNLNKLVENNKIKNVRHGVYSL